MTNAELAAKYDSDGWIDIARDFDKAEVDQVIAALKLESEALALLRELNDALAIPKGFQPRVDAVLDRAEEK